MKWIKRSVAFSLALALTTGGVATGASKEGRIVGVNEVSKEILLEDGVKIALDDDTMIMVDGKPSRFQAVKEGGKVKASYEKKDGKNTASTVAVEE